MKTPKRRNKFAILSGAGLQMGATIFLGAYFGKELDLYFETEKKWFTVGLTLFSVALSLYNLLKQLKRINEMEDE